MVAGDGSVKSSAGTYTAWIEVIEPTLVEVKPETQDFVPYGTPCCDQFDPNSQKLELLQCQLADMQKRIAALMADRDNARSTTVSEDDGAPPPLRRVRARKAT